ncbi:hypothetical protein GL218_04678 [Daldinia childiae]|uniref:uncharacterized protein n=1 Tax=Daldinia childiae TaxID=326645 RepID=UPI0014484786|nr:uncharacterized protein GL218_04678 [Daldinia childiae]KAF3059703.1 hypothetical protein GL218_04678 [Daldinia childiae]
MSLPNRSRARLFNRTDFSIKPFNWDGLPPEIHQDIFDLLLSRNQCSHDKHPKSTYAAVCLTWRNSFERENFAQLKISQWDLELFEQIVTTERKKLLGTLWFRVELRPYNCRSCCSKETNDEATMNSALFTDALLRFYDVMSKWGLPDGKHEIDLTVMLSAWSLSDREHYFRDHRFENDSSSVYRQYRVNRNDETHGWKGGYRIPPTMDACLRLVGKLLSFNPKLIGKDWKGSFPKLDFVTSLVIPRQFYRPIPRLDLILPSFPKLKVFQYEPWRAISMELERYQRFMFNCFLALLPPTLERFSVFEDFSEDIHASSRELRNFRIVRSLLSASRNFVELDVSFIIDAEQFFRRFLPKFKRTPVDLTWQNLQGLTLTSWTLLNPLKEQGRLDDLLWCVARAVLKMPKLEMMEIWACSQKSAGIFRYTRSCMEVCIEMEESENTHTLPERVMKVWQAVANRYTEGRLRTSNRYIWSSAIRTHRSALSYLERAERILSPASTPRLM